MAYPIYLKTKHKIMEKLQVATINYHYPEADNEGCFYIFSII